ncbi:uncharacterized protein [Rutidosis leptorrhynchoides]|uniref:uncharacterized protein n=1 Tax=Rutidosis leptorrhynchoides TaxID=125765 RepID=UPI003A995CA5
MNPNNPNSYPDINLVLTIMNTINNRALEDLERLDHLDELSDNEEVELVPRAPRRYLYRDREGRAKALWNHYFSDNCTFPDDYFCRRYRMRKPLFLRVCQAIRQLAYAATTDFFDEYLHMAGEAPPCTFTVNGCTFDKGYYLADGICLEWSTLVKSFRNPIDPKQSKFKKYQESARKDIERAFGILQSRWTIVQHPKRPYYIRKIRRIMLTCVILNNMITEGNSAFCGLEENYRPIRRARGTFQERVDAHMRADAELRDVGIHQLLRDMLVEHVYNLLPHYRIRHDPTRNPNNQDEVGPSHVNDDEDEGEDE